MARQKTTPNIDFKWSNQVWISNVFRLYEWIFGRAYGSNGIGDTIRAESSSSISFDVNGEAIVIQQFHTFEMFLVFVEMQLRSIFSGKMLPKIKKIYIPQLAPIGGYNLPGNIPYVFAIAFNATAQGVSSSAGATNITWTHVMGSVSNGLLLCGGYGQSASTSATYNSVSMTLIRSQNGSPGPIIDSYYIVSPSSGSHSIVVNYSSTQGLAWGSISYSGCAQTGVPDSNNGNQTNGTSLSVSTTVVAPNCWIFGTCGHDINTNNVSFTTGTTRQQATSTFQTIGVGDSNGTVGTGSQSFGATFASGNATINIASFAPIGTVTTTAAAFLLNLI